LTELIILKKNREKSAHKTLVEKPAYHLAIQWKFMACTTWLLQLIVLFHAAHMMIWHYCVLWVPGSYRMNCISLAKDNQLMLFKDISLYC